MAITDEFLAITIAIGLLYLFLYNHKIRWVRIIGCFAIIVISIGLVAIGDNIPMFIFMSINMMIAGLKFIFEVGDIIMTINKRSGKKIM